MNRLRLVSLKIDDVYLAFKDGLNYIVGKNNTGKTTIFNCIKYALGLSKENANSRIYSVDLEVRINDVDLFFSRNAGDLLISISFNNAAYRFRPMSKELSFFLNERFRPDYLFGREYENIFDLLSFCFLSEEHSANRRQQWEAINLVCGINVSLLKSLEKDIKSLEMEVYKSKEIEIAVESFLKLLKENLDERDQSKSLNESIEITKAEYFSKFQKDKKLPISATRKMEDIKGKLEYELKNKVSEVEGVFVSLKHFLGYSQWTIDDLESLVKGRNSYISYGQEIFSKFILVLAMAKASQEKNYNFPDFIINDSYLSGGLDEKAYRSAFEILEDVAGKEEGLQYIEFTNRNDVPKDYVVLNLDSEGGLHVFKD